MSSGTFKAAIPESIQEKIAAWQFSPPLTIALYKAIDDVLSNRPESQLGRQVVAPVRCFVVSFSLPDPDDPEIVCDLWLWVNTTEQPGVRIVIDVDHRVSMS